MPISPMYFQPLSPQQANPMLYGLQQGGQIAGGNLDNQMKALQNALASAQLPYAGQSAQADLQSKQIGNQLSQNTLNYAPQMSQAELKDKLMQAMLMQAQTGQSGAQTNLLNQQIKYLPLQASANADPLTKLLIGQQFTRNLNGGANAAPAINSSDGGMTVQPGAQAVTAQNNQVPPTGIPYRLPQASSNYPVLPGGLNQSQGAQTLQQLNTGTSPGNTNPGDLYSKLYGNELSQMFKNPTMGSTRSGAGGTYFDPRTGQTYTTDTSANTTLDQRTVAAIQRVTPLLNSISTNLSPFQNLTGQAQLNSGRAWNYLTPDSFSKSQSPNMYAQGQSALKIAPESLLRAWGLPITNESLERMESAIKPAFGETGDAYKTRIVNTLTELQGNQAQASARLKSGMPVDAAAGASQSNASSGGTVRVQTGDGKIWDIPQGNLDAALKRGAKQL